MGYNNAFTTGNLKKSVVAWSAFFFGEDKSQQKSAYGSCQLHVISYFIWNWCNCFSIPTKVSNLKNNMDSCNIIAGYYKYDLS